MEIEVPDAVADAIINQKPVDEAPHSFYKYPARFSPIFAREVIKAFTKVGETILDPFCGGGTSVVEAMALGRRAAGFDISSLAIFLARTKTTPISVHDKREILNWLEVVESLRDTDAKTYSEVMAEDAHYQRNLPETASAFFNLHIEWLSLLPKERQRKFVRLVMLAVGQWALDCKTETRSWEDLRIFFASQVREMVEKHYEFLTRVAETTAMPRCRVTQLRRVINRTSEESDTDGRIPSSWLPAKLVLTSPPYPGVHVLYHRWQINGRKETPAPFWLANSRDGAGDSYYCLGSRKDPELRTYFNRLAEAFRAIRSLVSQTSIVAQLVAFSEPEWQLPLYLEKLNEAGFIECVAGCDKKYAQSDGRIWRTVPGRRWYASAQFNNSAAKEVFLLHVPD